MSQPATVAPEYPHLTTNAQGEMVLAETTMRVVALVMAQRANGWSPEELHFQFPHLPLGHIHSALAYYWDHKAELDADIDRETEYVKEARREAGPSVIAAKLSRIQR
jgi:uncharacterized protein (DUF433 family)